MLETGKQVDPRSAEVGSQSRSRLRLGVEWGMADGELLVCLLVCWVDLALNTVSSS